jgi:thioredoxin-like negative regulator of GroEL
MIQMTTSNEESTKILETLETVNTSIFIEVTTQESYDKLILTKKICVVDFYTNWCGPCKKLSTELNETVKNNTNLMNLINNEKLLFLKINIGEDNEFAQNIANIFSIDSIPLIYFYKNGKLQHEKINGGDVVKIINMIDILNDEMNETNEINKINKIDVIGHIDIEANIDDIKEKENDEVDEVDEVDEKKTLNITDDEILEV